MSAEDPSPDRAPYPRSSSKLSKLGLPGRPRGPGSAGWDCRATGAAGWRRDGQTATSLPACSASS